MILAGGASTRMGTRQGAHRRRRPTHDRPCHLRPQRGVLQPSDRRPPRRTQRHPVRPRRPSRPVGSCGRSRDCTAGRRRTVGAGRRRGSAVPENRNPPRTGRGTGSPLFPTIRFSRLPVLSIRLKRPNPSRTRSRGGCRCGKRYGTPLASSKRTSGKHGVRTAAPGSASTLLRSSTKGCAALDDSGAKPLLRELWDFPGPI